jgi:hypothetical protein
MIFVDLPSQGPGFRWPYPRCSRPRADRYVGAMMANPPGASVNARSERIFVKGTVATLLTLSITVRWFIKTKNDPKGDPCR